MAEIFGCGVLVLDSGLMVHCKAFHAWMASLGKDRLVLWDLFDDKDWILFLARLLAT